MRDLKPLDVLASHADWGSRALNNLHISSPRWQKLFSLASVDFKLFFKKGEKEDFANLRVVLGS